MPPGRTSPSIHRRVTQYYGSKLLDASLLMLATVGFLPPDDGRIVGTVAAIEKGLVQDGFVRRYQTDATNVDGLSGTEGAFLMTTFWLADNLVLMGRIHEAQEIFDRLRGLRNDVGLLSEEYDPSSRRMLGNFPQAFSHVAFVNTAANLSLADRGPSMMRSMGSAAPDRGPTESREAGPAAMPSKGPASTPDHETIETEDLETQPKGSGDARAH
jgi:hypothetical protein